MSDKLYKNTFDAELSRVERKWEFRYQQQVKNQRELEATVARLRKEIKALKK